MKIDQPIKDLGPVNIDALRTAILAQDEPAWQENKTRQSEYAVHKQTETLVMIFCSDETWPNLDVTKEAGWNRLSEHAVPIMHDVIAEHYENGGTIIWPVYVGAL